MGVCSAAMGWFDDNHWAGEAYDFGRGYMARSAFSEPYGAPRGHRAVSRSWAKADDYYGRASYGYGGGAASTVGGRNALTGKFFYGTRKCSVCCELKVEADFDAAEANESAAKRCCLVCSRAIVRAIQSWEAKTPAAAPLAPAKPPAQEEPAPEPVPAPPVVIGRTHKVFGPDKSSFGTRAALPRSALPALPHTLARAAAASDRLSVGQ